ncbi:hypothetical protein Igag_0715 [Ignisphaera aggregans DSM 17230]|uniref:Uncharacterized protein n=1 Tax=Ignisphaera aggregans (strain DSM 17230 / JCM 13409 / AQ1.S1) TaxID=583356 RepID=E0ST68_IGNAA|nr:hypothetical protein Igag_0715 [Ignisphaera aggregans DSM 17230]
MTAHINIETLCKSPSHAIALLLKAHMDNRYHTEFYVRNLELYVVEDSVVREIDTATAKLDLGYFKRFERFSPRSAH